MQRQPAITDWSKDDDGRNVIFGEFAVHYLDTVLGGALNSPVFGIFHAVIGFKKHVAVFYRRYHVFELVAASLEKRIGHAGIRLVRVAFSSSVAGGSVFKLSGTGKVAQVFRF